MVRMNLEFDEEIHNKIVAIQEEHKLRKREDAIIFLLDEYRKTEVS
jgi:hypothetical protein